VDEVVDAVLSNVGVAIITYLETAHPMDYEEMQRLAKVYSVDDITMLAFDRKTEANLAGNPSFDPG